MAGSRIDYSPTTLIGRRWAHSRAWQDRPHNRGRALGNSFVAEELHSSFELGLADLAPSVAVAQLLGGRVVASRSPTARVPDQNDDEPYDRHRYRQGDEHRQQ